MPGDGRRCSSLAMPEHLLPYQRHLFLTFLTHLYPPTLACNRKSSKREVYAQLSELCGRSAVKRWWVTAQARLETSGARFYMGIERNEVFRINICHFKTSRVVVSLGQ